MSAAAAASIRACSFLVMVRSTVFNGGGTGGEGCGAWEFRSIFMAERSIFVEDGLGTDGGGGIL